MYVILKSEIKLNFLLVSTHSKGPKVIRPCDSSSKVFCCKKYILVMPSACGVLKVPSSDDHLLSLLSLSQLQDSFVSSHVFFTAHSHEPLRNTQKKLKFDQTHDISSPFAISNKIDNC